MDLIQDESQMRGSLGRPTAIWIFPVRASSSKPGPTTAFVVLWVGEKAHYLLFSQRAYTVLIFETN